MYRPLHRLLSLKFNIVSWHLNDCSIDTMVHKIWDNLVFVW